MPRILIVDDQTHVRKLFSEELSHEGYRVESVADAESIWRHLKDTRPDLVLLDLYLHGFEGCEVLRDIKKIDPNLPVLIVTAYDNFTDDPRLAQADGYVIKSFVGLGELKKKIAHILGRKTSPDLDTDGRPSGADTQSLK